MMNKARETILRLVAEGKITVEEADELLNAIEETSGRPGFFAGKRVNPQAREHGRQPGEHRERGFMEDFKFNFPWDQPNWQWPWDRDGWQWPWEHPDWQWPWDRPGVRKPSSVYEVPEEAQLMIRNDGGDLVIQGSDETSLKVTGSSPARNVRTEGKTIYISSAGDDLAIEVPAKTVSMEIAQNGGDLRVDNLKADMTIRVTGGDISVSRANSKIQISVEGGDVHLTDITSTEMEVRTNAGDISMSMLPTVEEGSFSLGVDSGDISLILPPDSRCQISASTLDGEVSHSLPQGSVEIIDEADNYLDAKLRGGGAEFTLATKTGDINIKA